MELALVLSLLSLTSTLVLSYFVYRTVSDYNRLTQGTQTKDLTSSINQFIKNVKQNQKELEGLDKKLNQFVQDSRLHFQKVGFLRFNPFSHTGGDQSFALCILDENNDGVVISSLHSRENTRVYAKKLVRGDSTDQVLSKEEKEVIKQALKS